MSWLDKEKRKIYDTRYRQKHADEIKEKNRKWRQKHKDYLKQYYQAHKDEALAYGKLYRQKNRDKYIASSKQYYEQNKDKEKQLIKAWRENHRERVCELERRHNSKRQRSLGFIPLNKYFEGSEAHHIDRNYVIYIPRELHQSIYHDLMRGTNMLIINALAVEYLQGERIADY